MRRIPALLSRIARRAGGFTLIETLVAVLLLSSAIAGPLTIASKGLSASLIARDQMIAFYLAQDAVEYVRFVRDTNKLSGNPWLANLDACTGADGCTVDPSSGTVDACSGACPYINKYDDGSGHVYFSYTEGTQTPQMFARTVTLAAPPDGGTDEKVLTVTVSWRAQSGVTRNIVVRENLFNWQ
jgi:prepilin-type N-terminal cleavage/methylation domain-containing protein